MIKAIFFDFDGVLTTQGGGCDAIVAALARKHGLLTEKLDPVFRDYNDRLLTAPALYASFLDELNEHMKSRITIRDILAGVGEAHHNLPMLTLAKTLREHSYITGIITDNNTERMEALHDSFGLNNFDPVVISAVVGAGKWQGPKIFHHALEAAGVAPDEAVFIDNDKNNVAAATAYGLHTHWHDHTKNDIAAAQRRLAELGIRSDV